MSYRLSSKKRQQRKSFVLRTVLTVFFALCGLGLFLLFGGTMTSLSSGTVETVSGLQKVLAGIAADEQELIIKNNELQNRLDAQTLDAQMQQAIVQRNNELLAELGRGDKVDAVLAGVVKKPPFSPYDIYTIDAGRNEGVAVGDIALFSDYVTLGQVTRSTESGAKIDLFSAPRKETQVNLNGTSFLLVGQGGGTMQIDAPRDFEVTEGDFVILPGYNLYIAGTVVEIVAKPQDSFKKIMIQVPVNIEAVSLVTIVPFITEL